MKKKFFKYGEICLLFISISIASYSLFTTFEFDLDAEKYASEEIALINVKNRYKNYFSDEKNCLALFKDSIHLKDLLLREKIKNPLEQGDFDFWGNYFLELRRPIRLTPIIQNLKETGVFRGHLVLNKKLNLKSEMRRIIIPIVVFFENGTMAWCSSEEKHFIDEMTKVQKLGARFDGKTRYYPIFSTQAETLDVLGKRVPPSGYEAEKEILFH